MATHATIITIGDELLIGQVTDTNSGWMAKHLNDLGIGVRRRIAVGDDAALIKETLTDALRQSDVVLITGGLGPTKDDITKKTLAEFFNCAMVTNDEVRNDVTDYFKRSKRPLLDTNLQQADVPDAATVIRNKRGTAPGMWFERDGKIIVSMPGVPYEMTAMMEEHVLSKLKEKFSGSAIVHKTIMTCGIGESFLAEKIKDWENNLPPHVKLAYLPNLMQVRLRLTATGNDEEELKNELERLVQHALPLIDEYVFGLDEISLEEVLGIMLKEKDAYLATAESCTGGYIASKITATQGASEWYKGSMVTYAEELKTDLLGVPKKIIDKYGVVSKQVAKRMARRVARRLGTQYAIGVTGWADPNSTQDDDPPGLIWIGWWDGKKATAKPFQFLRTRQQNIELATTAALNGMRRILQGQG